MSTDGHTRAWVEIRANGVRRNLERIRESVGPDVALIPMVKADAYGTGMARCVGALEPLEPWGFGVATVEEGMALRDLGVERPILVATPLPPGAYRRAVEADLTVSISDLAGLQRLSEAAHRLGGSADFHLEVDTGMGRAGFDWRQAGDWGKAVSALAGGPLRWKGCFTHFHSADAGDPSATDTQWSRFNDALGSLDLPEDDFLVHLCNSAGVLRRPMYGRGGVRPGIFLYGAVAGEGLPDPEPVVTLRARVTFIRDTTPGSTVGYGATYTAKKWERWASIGIGYGDGLPRALGNKGHGIVKGRRVPIIGRISMDVTVLNITEVDDVELGDLVTLVGRDGGESITLEEVASHADTINYEILTGLTQRLPRIWLEEGG